MQAIDTQDKQFHDGNGTTELGTILPAWWLNQVQSELLGVLTAANITPNKTKTNQLTEAIQKLFPTKHFTLTAGAGLTGGGDLSANRTIALATPATLSGSTTNASGNANTGHTHEIAKATATQAGVVKLINALNHDATDAALTAAMGKTLNDEKLGKRGNQTLSGSLKVGEASQWTKLQFPVESGGQWIFETNPKSALSTEGSVRLNLRYLENNQSRYIHFPDVRQANQTVAYQTWVNGAFVKKSGDAITGYLTINQQAYPKLQLASNRGEEAMLLESGGQSGTHGLIIRRHQNGAVGASNADNDIAKFMLPNQRGRQTLATLADIKHARPVVLGGATEVDLNLANRASIIAALGTHYINNGELQLVLHNSAQNHRIHGLPLGNARGALQLTFHLMGGFSSLECHYLSSSRRFVSPINWNNETLHLNWTETTTHRDFPATLAETGYQKCPSGLIWQWGKTERAGETLQNITFPIAFPNACLNAQATAIHNGVVGGSSVLGAHIGSVSRTGLSCAAPENGGHGQAIYWFAIGH